MKPKTSTGGPLGVLVLVMFVALVGLLVALPEAHAKLEKSEPAANAMLNAPPPHVRLWFNEKPDVAVTKIVVTGPSGVVTLGPAHAMDEMSIMAAVKGTLAPGNYVVTWQTAGDDGHVLKGDFPFMVH